MKEQEAKGLRSLVCEKCGKRWWHNPYQRSAPRDTDGRLPSWCEMHLNTGVLEFGCTCGAPGMVPIYLKRKKY